jgi:fumarate reductase (CoM/CoB) subunit A
VSEGNGGFTVVKTLQTDVLIIGGGLAGLRAALSARRAGSKVLIVGKRQIGRSGSSVNTTGGYAAVMGEINACDDERLHEIDTIAGGGYVNDRALVKVLVHEAPVRLRELIELGAKFRGENGHYYRSPSGDHSRHRVMVPENMRGLDLTKPLRDAAVATGAEFLEDCVVLDLLCVNGAVVGAACVHRLRPQGFLIYAGAVILAAGGAGQLFPTTSNPVDVCGSGYALALRAGACLRDMEFIQFYPWRLIRPFKSVRVPIQPSTFALGGKLYNSRGDRFMCAYDPVRNESTTRDLSARGIADQINQGLSVEGGVVLDVSEVPDEQFRFENPRVIDLLARKNIDYRNTPLIVAPEAHYFMGGVDIDATGRSNVPRLYVAGENAGGVHGGNRLNSNSVPDTQVFGHRAGVAAAEEAGTWANQNSAASDAGFRAALCERIAGLTTGEPVAGFDNLRESLREVMSRTLGLVRNRAGLEMAIATAREMHAKAGAIPLHSHGDLIAAAELKDMCETALACAESALCRTESRAAHYRSDFPETNPDWIKTVLYDHGTSVRPIERAPDEDLLLAMRASCTVVERPGREHVE